jgi:predicted RNA-binding protein
MNGVLGVARYWLCVTDEENFGRVRKWRQWGVSEKNRAKMQNVRKGDMLVFYVKPNQIAGIFKATSKPFMSEKRIFEPTRYYGEKNVFPNRVRVEPVLLPGKRASFGDLTPKLTFVTNKAEWRAYIRRAMRPISEGDYSIIANSLGLGRTV